MKSNAANVSVEHKNANELVVEHEALVKRIKQKVRRDISPRHVPNDVFAVQQIPYTLSGKKMEVPIRKILLGQPPEKAANPGAMRNPESLQYFSTLAEQLRDSD